MKNDDVANTPADALAVVPDATPVSVEAPSKELIVRDGQVILPETKCVTPISKEFEEVLAKAIPHDELLEVLEALHGRRPAYTPAMKLLFLAGFAFIGALAFLFRPHPPQLLDSSRTLVIDTQTPSKVSSDFLDLLKQANEAFIKGRYGEVIETISPQMGVIMKDKESFRVNARLVSLYFSSLQKMGFPKDAPGFDEWLDNACNYDLDNLEWQIYKICLLWQPFQNIYKAEYSLNALLNDEKQSIEVAKACIRIQKQIERIRTLDDNKPAESRLSKNTITSLDLIECQVLITMWRLDGGKTLPDDKGDPGVEFREKAYSLTTRHENDVAFLDLQLYLAQKVLDGLIPFSPHRFYFNGEIHWTRNALLNLVNNIRQKKEKLSLNRKP